MILGYQNTVLPSVGIKVFFTNRSIFNYGKTLSWKGKIVFDSEVKTSLINRNDAVSTKHLSNRSITMAYSSQEAILNKYKIRKLHNIFLNSQGLLALCLSLIALCLLSYLQSDYVVLTYIIFAQIMYLQVLLLIFWIYGDSSKWFQYMSSFMAFSPSFYHCMNYFLFAWLF